MANTTAGQTASNSNDKKGEQASPHGLSDDNERHDSMIPPEDRAIAVDSPMPQARDQGSAEFDPLSSSNKFINGTATFDFDRGPLCTNCGTPGHRSSHQLGKCKRRPLSNPEQDFLRKLVQSRGLRSREGGSISTSMPLGNGASKSTTNGALVQAPRPSWASIAAGDGKGSSSQKSKPSQQSRTAMTPAPVPQTYRTSATEGVRAGELSHGRERLWSPPDVAPPHAAIAHYGTPQHVTPQSGAPQYGAQYGAPQYVTPQYGTTQYGTPQYGTSQHGTTQYGTPQYVMPHYGIPHYGIPQYGPPMPTQKPYEYLTEPTTESVLQAHHAWDTTFHQEATRPPCIVPQSIPGVSWDQVDGHLVDVYLERSAVFTMRSPALFRFSFATHQRGSMIKVSARENWRLVLQVDRTKHPPSEQAVRDVCKWMLSTRPYQHDGALPAFPTFHINRIDITDLLDLYQALCLFDLRPPSVWHSLFTVLSRRINRPLMLWQFRSFLAHLSIYDQIVKIALDGIYRGYINRGYSVEEWLELKAFLLDREEDQLSREVYRCFVGQHGRRENARCFDCVAGCWRLGVQDDSSDVPITNVCRKEDLYCAQHARVRSINRGRPVISEHNVQSTNTASLPKPRSSPEEVAPTVDLPPTRTSTAESPAPPIAGSSLSASSIASRSRSTSSIVSRSRSATSTSSRSRSAPATASRIDSALAVMVQQRNSGRRGRRSRRSQEQRGRELEAAKSLARLRLS